MPATETASPDERRQRPEPDFRLDGFEDETETARRFFREIGLMEDMLVPLAQHHGADGAHSFYVLYDSSATYGHPGDPHYIALRIQRDVKAKTFDFEHAHLPLPAMAQSWLIHRGCPPDAIGLDAGLGPRPADGVTRALEQRLTGDGDNFALGYSYTSDNPNDWVTVAALRELHERSPAPFRVVVEEVDMKGGTYTLREGGFATVEAALTWCYDRLSGEAGPLPPIRPSAPATPPVVPPKAPASRPPGRAR